MATPPAPDADLDGSPIVPAPPSPAGRTSGRIPRPRRIRTRARILVCCLALAPLTLAALGENAQPAPSAVAPPIDLPTRKGVITPADLAGKLVYVDFWASWCGPCRLSFPWLKKMHEK